MIFQSSMGLGKSRCDVLSDTTQGCFCLIIKQTQIKETIHK